MDRSILFYEDWSKVNGFILGNVKINLFSKTFNDFFGTGALHYLNTFYPVEIHTKIGEFVRCDKCRSNFIIE